MPQNPHGGARLKSRDRSLKEVDGTLTVYANTPSGWLAAGELELEERGAAADTSASMFAKFRYADSFLTHRHAFPLDPINLPLQEGWFETTHQHVKLGAIFDAAPDAWGRRVVQSQLAAQALAAAEAKDGLGPGLLHLADDDVRIYRQALLRGADGIGALLVTPSTRDRRSTEQLDSIIAQSILERPALSELEPAARAARDLELNGQVTPGMEHLLAGSWTIGGARPKAIVRDDRPGAPPGSSVIVKFASAGETVARNQLEAAVLDMLADFELDGQRLDVPAHTIREVDVRGQREDALVIQRFDRVWRRPDVPLEDLATRTDPLGERLRAVPPELLEVRPDTTPEAWREAFIGSRALRLHYVSAISVMSMQLQSKRIDTPADIRNFSWKRLIEIAAKIAAKPDAARVQMFTRLLVNAALNNSDDHLKNFGFIRLENHPLHYRVAPIFDITPQPSPSHYLHCANLGRSYTMEQAVSRAAAVGISPAIAQRIRDALMTVLDRRTDYFDARRMTREQQQTVQGWIARGMGRPNITPPTQSPAGDSVAGADAQEEQRRESSPSSGL